MIDPALIQSYRETKYVVFNPALVITIGELHPALDALLLEHGVEEWAFITASNPFSKQLPEGVNGARFALLKQSLEGYIFFEGEGVGTDPDWKPEQSLLVLGMTENEAINTGNSFEQNAVVAGQLYATAELLLLDEWI